MQWYDERNAKRGIIIMTIPLLLGDPHGVGGNTIWDQDGCVEWQVA